MSYNYSVSVIVPVYNVENYLQACLDSLVNQNFDNYEIIVVNDGSTDGCQKIIERYCDRYSIMKLVNKENGGLSSARNQGVQFATGEYICFVDSDDYVEPDFIKELYETAKQNGSDAVVCGYNRIDEQYGNTKIANLNIDTPYNKKYDSDYKIFDLSPYAWNKLFRHSIITNSEIVFPQGRVYEDIPVVFPWLSMAEKITVVDKPLYNYRVNRNGSIMTDSLSKSFDMLESLLDLNRYFKYDMSNLSCMDKLCAFNVKHIMYRLCEFKGYKDKKMKSDFINASFSLLDEQFPLWKNCSYFYKYKNGLLKPVKKWLMTKKLFWKYY